MQAQGLWRKIIFTLENKKQTMTKMYNEKKTENVHDMASKEGKKK